MRYEARDILRPVAQRRHRDPDDVDPVQQVLSQSTGPHQLVDVAVGGHDDADVHGDRSHPTDPTQFTMIEHLEELRLHFR